VNEIQKMKCLPSGNTVTLRTSPADLSQ
jgi:hypothetical protein